MKLENIIESMLYENTSPQLEVFVNGLISFIRAHDDKYGDRLYDEAVRIRKGKKEREKETNTPKREGVDGPTQTESVDAVLRGLKRAVNPFVWGNKRLKSIGGMKTSGYDSKLQKKLTWEKRKRRLKGLRNLNIKQSLPADSMSKEEIYRTRSGEDEERARIAKAMVLKYIKAFNKMNTSHLKVVIAKLEGERKRANQKKADTGGAAGDSDMAKLLRGLKK
jgi:hypothetical protein